MCSSQHHCVDQLCRGTCSSPPKKNMGQLYGEVPPDIPLPVDQQWLSGRQHSPETIFPRSYFSFSTSYTACPKGHTMLKSAVLPSPNPAVFSLLPFCCTLQEHPSHLESGTSKHAQGVFSLPWEVGRASPLMQSRLRVPVFVQQILGGCSSMPESAGPGTMSSATPVGTGNWALGRA